MLENEIKYKIIDVDPVECAEDLKNITLKNRKWMTTQPKVTITIEFNAALINFVEVKNYKCDKVSCILYGEKIQEMILINSQEFNWDPNQEIIYPLETEEYYKKAEIIIDNVHDGTPKGLIYFKIVGFQNDISAQSKLAARKAINQANPKIYKINLQKKSVEFQQEESIVQQEQNGFQNKPSKSKDKNNHDLLLSANTRILKADNKSWNFYKKPVQQESFQYSDPRENLLNVQEKKIRKKSSSSVEEIRKEEMQQMQEEKQGVDIDDSTMSKYGIEQVDTDFIFMHTQLQSSLNLDKKLKLSDYNWRRVWKNE